MRAGGSEGEPVLGDLGHGFDHLRVSVTQNHGSPGTNVIEVGVPIHVGHGAAAGGLEDDGFPSDRFEGPYRAIHAAR